MSADVAVPPRIKLRIEGLSDIVFGLSLSIGSIILINNFPKTAADLGQGILLFTFSFGLIILSWVGYTRTMAVLPVEVQGAFFLNIVLLLCVVLEPYLFYVLQSTTDPSLLYWASAGYAIDIGAIFLILAGLARLLVREAKSPKTELRAHPVVVERFRSSMKASILSRLVFLASALPFAWVETPIGYLRFQLWYFSIPIFVVWMTARRRKVSSRTQQR